MAHATSGPRLTSAIYSLASTSFIMCLTAQHPQPPILELGKQCGPSLCMTKSCSQPKPTFCDLCSSHGPLWKAWVCNSQRFGDVLSLSSLSLTGLHSLSADYIPQSTCFLQHTPLEKMFPKQQRLQIRVRVVPL